MITAFAPDVPSPARTDLERRQVRLEELADIAVDLAVDLAVDAAADGSGGGPRIHLDVTVPASAPITTWPDEELVGRLLAAGIESVRLFLPADLDAAVQVGLISLLVHAQSLGLPLSWRLPSGVGGPIADVDLLHHLPPPDGDTPAEVSWRRRHDYGLCYWRHGLTFATVTDLRDAADAARFTLDDPAYVELFTGLDVPRPADSLSEAEHAVLADLLEARLVLLAAGHVVRLPFRLRRWPMPLHDLR